MNSSGLMSFAAFPHGLENDNPLWKWFGERLDLGEGRELCRGLIFRVQAFLPAVAKA